MLDSQNVDEGELYKLHFHALSIIIIIMVPSKTIGTRSQADFPTKKKSAWERNISKNTCVLQRIDLFIPFNDARVL